MTVQYCYSCASLVTSQTMTNGCCSDISIQKQKLHLYKSEHLYHYAWQLVIVIKRAQRYFGFGIIDCKGLKKWPLRLENPPDEKGLTKKGRENMRTLKVRNFH